MYFLRIPILLTILSFLTGCLSADGGDQETPCVTPGPGLHECGLVNQDVNRYYQLRVPSAYNPETPTPLILDLHGFSSPVIFGLSGERLVSGIERVGEDNGVIVAWPQGIRNAWNSILSTDVKSGDINDADFLRALVLELKNNLNVDESRVYVMGISNGGAMAQILACESPDIFAATATVAFQLPTPANTCIPNRTAPIIAFHAPTDILVPYNGMHIGLGHSGLSAPESYDAWSDINQCTDESEIFFSKGNSSCEIRDECSSDAEVAFCQIDGAGTFLGGHLTYFNNGLVNWSDLVWDFFVRHEL